ncbi:MAG: lamin tail domain-containing protein, partial [Phycisphaerales bacterium]
GIYANPEWEDQYEEEAERPVSVEFFDPCGAAGQFHINAVVRTAGGSSTGGWKSDKLSMRLKFQEPYGPTKLNFPLFQEDAAESFDTLVLDARLNNAWNYGRNDTQRRRAQYTRDQFTSDVQNAVGGYGHHGQHVHLYLNGLYWGLYNLHERPDESFAASYFGGNKKDYDVIKHNYGIVVNGSNTNYREMFDIAQAGLSSDSQYQSIQQYLDVPNFIDYIITNFYYGNTDWAGHNWYATRSRFDPESRWRFHSWDAEKGMQGLNDNVTGKDNGYGSPTRLHQRLKDNPEYRMLFADHVHRHFFDDGLLTVDNATALYQHRLDAVDRAVVGESARWGDNRTDQGGIRYTRDEHWVDQRDWLLNTYLPQRTNVVLSQLKSRGLYPNVKAPGFSQHGGWDPSGFTLTITNLNGSGTIYYTTDGADPREYLTGNPVGAQYARLVALTESTCVKARVLSGSTWSALNEATFAVGPVADNLRITEIMYHPQDTNDPNDPNEEFIELKNIGAQTLNLNLVRFTNGIDFTFPSLELAADEYILVVRDIEAFSVQYGIGYRIAGQYSGSLNNGGERIELEDAAGRTILNFRYRDGWYNITDGMGFSLTIIDPAGADSNEWDSKSGWRPSAGVGGSPGWDDAGEIPRLGEVVINELLAHSHANAPDWIELHNTTDASINVGGWFLSDSSTDFMKYEIAAGTTIGPLGYVVLYEDLHFGNLSDPGCHAPFALSENGERLYLHSGQDGSLTGYNDEEKFDASETGIAFGRHRKSTGTYNFVAMSENTPGSANAYPKVGPIVINEIMYNPASGNQDEEYIELLNISDAAVILAEYDNEQLIDVPWQLSDQSGGISFDFPLGTTMAAGEYLLLVKDKDVFNSGYPAVPGGVQIFEWGAGRLDNGGEKVQLAKPGDEVEGTRHYIRVDRINYSDGSHPAGQDPWPTGPDAGGSSLSRKVPAHYGNDPNNWTAAIPSPGE